MRDTYGAEAVSQIATFGTMASKAVIRDAGRVLDMPYTFCDQLSKLIPIVQAKPVSLAKAREIEPLFAEREKKGFRVLWSSEGFHDLALMASSKVPQAHVDAIAAAFFAMHLDPGGRKTLEAASAVVSLTVEDHFVPASMDDYQNYVGFFEAAPAFLR